MHYWECFQEPCCKIKGKRSNVEGKGCVDVNNGILEAEVLITLMMFERYNWPWFLQSHLSSVLRSQAQNKVWNRHPSLCIDLWNGYSILNNNAEETPGLSYVRDPYHCCPTSMGQGTLLYKLTQNLSGNHLEGVGISHPPQFESVKPFSLSSTSNAWHKETKTLYKCINIR